ncbi:response regulator [Oleiphilus sp. HI0066]|uniref:response regulator n=4 Tax=unclassified Oleiphilus TaxID=2631174 RepID=UPI0007C2152B|nr:response regulator [Oleiphilus sp. HI0066]KZY66768.1 hypothetical protein A3738_00590 [Oleiphilus sp. HI0066]
MSKKGLFKILVVDDEEQILDSLRRLFRSNDFEIICETNPIEAIEILSITRFDVIICDMRMPQMSGADFLVRAKKIRPAAERILLTGYADLDSTIKSINDAQIYAFVTKPWDPNQLVQLVASAIEKQHKEKVKIRILRTLKETNEEIAQANERQETEIYENKQDIQRQRQTIQDMHTLAAESWLNLLDLRFPGYRVLVNHFKIILDRLIDAFAINSADAETMIESARLHAIGKLSLSDEILQLNYRDMNTQQKKEYEQYPHIGACALMPFIQFLGCADLIFKQKERIDGKGFPQGLDKQKLDKSNIIFNTVLEYTELRYSPYSKQQSHHDTMSILRSAPLAYDPEVLEYLETLDWKKKEDNSCLEEIHLPVNSLNEGMIANKDVYSKGLLIIQSGTPFDNNLISKLKLLEHYSSTKILVNVLIPSDHKSI